jgi:hypothetical protein
VVPGSNFCIETAYSMAKESIQTGQDVRSLLHRKRGHSGRSVLRTFRIILELSIFFMDPQIKGGCH